VPLRARGICEACENEAPFKTKTGRPFLKVHHPKRMSDGGPDHPNNVAAVCPNCHRRGHFSHDRETFNADLNEIILDKESKFN